MSCNLQSTYVFYKNKFIKNYGNIQEGFRAFPEFLLSYSLKTNNSPLVLDVLMELGGTVEVVSPWEYELVLKHGFDPERIIYNGPCKTQETLVHCAQKGGIVNLDNQNDLEWVLEYYSKTGKPLSVGLRLNFDIGNHLKSRFGVKKDSPLYEQIVQAALEKKLVLEVLHCHFTQGRELKFWKNRAEGMCNAWNELRKRGIKIKWLDFGGNMHGFGTASDYASCISSVMKNNQVDCGVILECGTPLVQDAFTVEGTVLCVKDNQVITDISIFDIGLNVFSDTCRIKLLPVNRDTGTAVAEQNNPAVQDKNRAYTIVGCTCMENDIIKKSWCGNPHAGDKIIVYDCGAYSYSWGNDFISPRLPVIQK